MKNILIIVGIFIFSFQVDTYSSNSPETSLGTIIKNTKKMYASGIDKKKIAQYINGEVDKRIKCTNNIELWEDPLNWGRLLVNRKTYTDLESGSYEDTANVAWTTGLGNCEENSTIVYYILKKAGVKEHVRILRTAKHSFTVWGIHPSAKTDKPLTWGEDAIVVDPWLGQDIEGKDVETNKWFKNNNPDAKITDFTNYSDSNADTWNTINSKYNRDNNIKPEPEPKEIEDCFIATAVYGSPSTGEIQILRRYRENILRKKKLGRLFIAVYERFGPIAAFYIRHKEKEKKWVRHYIVEPSVKFAKQELKKK